MFKHRINEQMSCFRFGNVINNATITSTFFSDNINIAKIKTKQHQIMATIAKRILKFELMVKK